MAANPDFKDLFVALCDQQAEFIVVGAHAVMIFTEPRYTKDLDVWVRPSANNASPEPLLTMRTNVCHSWRYRG
jgi:hypothetical protein